MCNLKFWNLSNSLKLGANYREKNKKQIYTNVSGNPVHLLKYTYVKFEGTYNVHC